MKNTLAFLAIFAVAAQASGAVTATLNRVATGVTGTNGATDAYRIQLSNTGTNPVTSVEYRLPGSYRQGADLVRSQGVFAASGASFTADTFVVAPAGVSLSSVLSAEVTDTLANFSIAYTIDTGVAGTSGTIVPAGGSALTAILAVPAGTAISTASFVGRAVTGPLVDGPGDVLETISFTLGNPLLAGDFDGNGSVGNGDLTLLLANWSAAVPALPSGWNGSMPTPSAIGNDELTALLSTWGQSSATAVSVPEPTALFLGLIATVCVGRRRA